MAMGRSYHREYQRFYYKKKRGDLESLLGGKCVICSSIKDLQFDHIDPLTKSFSIGCLLSHSKKNIDKEISKCQLLCRPCHTEKTLMDNGRKRSEHGSYNKYSHGCRCDMCRSANTKYSREYRKKKKFGGV